MNIEQHKITPQPLVNGLLALDLITTSGNFICPDANIKNAHNFITIEIEQYEPIIKSILNIRHFNYLKQFMIKLFRNNLYFKNDTLKFSDSGTICNSCKSKNEDRIHLFKCKIHAEIIDNLFFGFTELKTLKKKPCIEPYFSTPAFT